MMLSLGSQMTKATYYIILFMRNMQNRQSIEIENRSVAGEREKWGVTANRGFRLG